MGNIPDINKWKSDKTSNQIAYLSRQNKDLPGNDDIEPKPKGSISNLILRHPNASESGKVSLVKSMEEMINKWQNIMPPCLSQLLASVNEQLEKKVGLPISVRLHSPIPIAQQKVSLEINKLLKLYHQANTSGRVQSALGRIFIIGNKFFYFHTQKNIYYVAESGGRRLIISDNNISC